MLNVGIVDREITWDPRREVVGVVSSERHDTGCVRRAYIKRREFEMSNERLGMPHLMRNKTRFNYSQRTVCSTKLLSASWGVYWSAFDAHNCISKGCERHLYTTNVCTLVCDERLTTSSIRATRSLRKLVVYSSTDTVRARQFSTYLNRPLVAFAN